VYVTVQVAGYGKNIYATYDGSQCYAVTEKHITIIITNDIILNIFFMYFSSIFIGVLFYPLQFSAGFFYG